LVSKQKIKDIKSLQQPKFRQIYNKFVAEGDKVVTEFIKNQKYSIDEVFIIHASVEKYNNLLQNTSIPQTAISEKEMSMISGLKTPSDILILLHKSEDTLNDKIKPPSKAIYLDGVQDPGNVGTIIRIADWFGISMVIRSHDSADFFSPKVVQSNMGSMCNISLITSDLKDCSVHYPNIIGTFMEGGDISILKEISQGLLVMGSEGKGIRPQNIPFITNKVSITGAQNRIADSLNVSVATGILCTQWS